jgi:hypothetical protein
LLAGLVAEQVGAALTLRLTGLACLARAAVFARSAGPVHLA